MALLVIVKKRSRHKNVSVLSLLYDFHRNQYDQLLIIMSDLLISFCSPPYNCEKRLKKKLTPNLPTHLFSFQIQIRTIFIESHMVPC